MSPFVRNRHLLLTHTALTAPALVGALMLGEPALANPAGGKVVTGSAAISKPNKNTVEVRQHSERAIVEWQKFNISPGETTRFVQPTKKSVTLNRVVGSTEPSRIAGRLQANGTIVLVNQNGVVFDGTSRIDVGALITTTHDIENDNFMAGRMNFNIHGRPDAAITNLGSITAADHGLVALVAPSVRNDGIIVARLGKIALAAGDGFSVDMYGDDLIQLVVDPDHPAAQHLVQNTGRLSADGGYVLLTAGSARNVVNSVVNNDGIVEARSIGRINGEIALLGEVGSSVNVSGTLDATGNDQGETGGRIIVTGEEVTVKTGAKLDASGQSGGGRVLVGGDYLGGKSSGAPPHRAAALEENPVFTAKKTTVEQGATINASAVREGDGGKLIVWSDEYTRADGHLFAFSPTEHAGGFVETSSAGELSVRVADVSAGIGGLWLLDPDFVTLTTGVGSISPVTSGGETSFNSSELFSSINDSVLSAALDTGTNVTVQATRVISTDGTAPQILKTVLGSSTLTMEAGEKIELTSGSIQSNSQPGSTLDVQLIAPEVAINGLGFDLNGGALNVEASNRFEFQPTFLREIGQLGLASDANIFVAPFVSSSSSVKASDIESILNQGGSVTLDTTGGTTRSVTLLEDISKSSGGNSTFRIDTGSLSLNNNITSSSGKLNVRFAGEGDTSSFTMTALVENGVQTGSRIETNGGDFQFSGAALNVGSSSVTYRGGFFNIPLQSPHIRTDGGAVSLSFLSGPHTATANNPAGFRSFIGLGTTEFFAGNPGFVIDSGTGSISIDSDVATTNLANMPIITLGDKGVRTSGNLSIGRVNILERQSLLSGGVRFDGPGNGVAAAEFNSLTVIDGAFNVQDQVNTGAPPPPVDTPPVAFPGTVSLPNAERGSFYAQTTQVLFSDDQPIGGLTLVVTGLPAGLTATPNGDGTVTVSGIPVTSGSIPFTVIATDAAGNTASIFVDLTVNDPPPPPPIDTPPVAFPGTVSLPNAERDTFYSQTTRVLFSDDQPVSALTLVTTGLPAGLTATGNSNGTVTIAGTPVSSGPITFSVTATDAAGNTASISVDLIVNDPPPPPPIDTPPVAFPGTVSLPNAERGSFYSQTTRVLFSDDQPVSGLTLVTTGLPAGLTATPNSNGTVTISGTPVTSGSIAFSVTATDAAGNTAFVSVDLRIDIPPLQPPADLPPSIVTGAMFQPDDGIFGQRYLYISEPLVLDEAPEALAVTPVGLPDGLDIQIDAAGRVIIFGVPQPSVADQFDSSRIDLRIVISDSSNPVNISVNASFRLSGRFLANQSCIARGDCGFGNEEDIFAESEEYFASLLLATGTSLGIDASSTISTYVPFLIAAKSYSGQLKLFGDAWTDGLRVFLNTSEGAAALKALKPSTPGLVTAIGLGTLEFVVLSAAEEAHAKNSAEYTAYKAAMRTVKLSAALGLSGPVGGIVEAGSWIISDTIELFQMFDEFDQQGGFGGLRQQKQATLELMRKSFDLLSSNPNLSNAERRDIESYVYNVGPTTLMSLDSVENALVGRIARLFVN